MNEQYDSDLQRIFDERLAALPTIRPRASHRRSRSATRLGAVALAAAVTFSGAGMANQVNAAAELEGIGCADLGIKVGFWLANVGAIATGAVKPTAPLEPTPSMPAPTPVTVTSGSITVNANGVMTSSGPVSMTVEASMAPQPNAGDAVRTPEAGVRMLDDETLEQLRAAGKIPADGVLFSRASLSQELTDRVVAAKVTCVGASGEVSSGAFQITGTYVGETVPASSQP